MTKCLSSDGGFWSFVETVLTPVARLYRLGDRIEKRIEAALEARLLQIDKARFDRAFAHPVIGRACDVLVRSEEPAFWSLLVVLCVGTSAAVTGWMIPFVFVWIRLNPGIPYLGSIVAMVPAFLAWFLPFYVGFVLALSVLGGLIDGLKTLKVRYECVQWADWVRRGNSQNVPRGWVYSRS